MFWSWNFTPGDSMTVHGKSSILSNCICPKNLPLPTRTELLTNPWAKPNHPIVAFTTKGWVNENSLPPRCWAREDAFGCQQTGKAKPSHPRIRPNGKLQGINRLLQQFRALTAWWCWSLSLTANTKKAPTGSNDDWDLLTETKDGQTKRGFHLDAEQGKMLLGISKQQGQT